MKNVFLIPARSGSKGIKNKNLSLINNQSLIEHAVTFASKCCRAPDEIFISTDSREYEGHAIRAGAKSLGLRDPALSTDSSRSSTVIKNFFQQLTKNKSCKIDFITLIQPTSPLRTKDLFEECLEIAADKNEIVTTIAPLVEPNPHKLLKLNGTRINPLFEGGVGKPRQSLPTYFLPTGSIYVYPVKYVISDDELHPTRGVVQNNFVNIDETKDLELARILMHP